MPSDAKMVDMNWNDIHGFYGRKFQMIVTDQVAYCQLMIDFIGIIKPLNAQMFLPNKI